MQARISLNNFPQTRASECTIILMVLVFTLGSSCTPVTLPRESEPLAKLGQDLHTASLAAPAQVMAFTPQKQAVHTPVLPLGITKPKIKVEESPLTGVPSVTITVIFDNNTFDPRLKTAWGFSALVEYGRHTLLFDTGGDGRILRENMRILGIDPTRIESVVLSHAHGDHTGGLAAVLESASHPVVYLLPSFAEAYKEDTGRKAKVVEVSRGLMITEGLYTTGEIAGGIPEQALIVHTPEGLIVITGCAHPGIVDIVELARGIIESPISLVLGGFHLSSKSNSEIEAILNDFQGLEVSQVAPCHCTGELAIRMFAERYGDNFIQVGVGSVIQVEAIKTR